MQSTGAAQATGMHVAARRSIWGPATDLCVAWTALDGRRVGLKVFVIKDTSRGDLKASVAKSSGDWRTPASSASSRLTSW